MAVQDFDALLPQFFCYFSNAEKPTRGRPIGCLSIAIHRRINCSHHQVEKKRNILIMKGEYFAAAVAYFPPNTPTDQISLEICKALDTVKHSKLLILGGDFNCRLDDNSRRGSTLCRNLDKYNLSCTNDQSLRTHTCHNGSSVIDLLFISNLHNTEDTVARVSQCAVSKHQMVSCEINGEVEVCLQRKKRIKKLDVN